MNRLDVIGFELGPLQTNCYLVVDKHSNRVLVIDPADEGEMIWKFLQDKKLIPEKILLTHGHCDHIGGVNVLKELSGMNVWIHEEDEEMFTDPQKNFSYFLGTPYTGLKPDGLLKDGMEVEIGASVLKVLHTPGHTPGSVSFVGDNFAIVGDTLFQSSVGRTDFPGSSQELLIDSIRQKLLVLNDKTIVYPGHGPATTIERERKENPFIV